ncbi:MAG: outer membrane lipoprotein carrier protein LolA [Bacteroidales bacterium]|nr:outer membrane lipoprotein carrier protein LolA [Bacteroidales bacterium]
MHKILKFIVIVFFINTSVFAQSDFKPLKDVASFKNKIKEMSKTTRSIECNFVQEKSLSVLTKKIISKGYFCFKKENNIRWEYFEPYKYLVVIVNNKISVKDDKSKKQYDSRSNAMFKEFILMMFNFIQGNIDACEKDYTITCMENEHSYYMKMIPKSEKVKKMLSQVDLYFDKKDLTVSRIKMLETGGDYTCIDFINKKINMNIPDEKFRIK